MKSFNDRSPLAAADTVMELRCVVARPILDFLAAEFGRERTREIVAETRMSYAYVEDTSNWISFDYFCRLLRKLVEVTKDGRAPFTAALNYTNKTSYGFVGIFFLHLATPGTVYRLITQLHSVWDRICEYRMLASGSNWCTLSVKFPRRAQDRNNCLALQGSFAAVPRAFGLPAAQVTERACACDGAEACVYDITWAREPERLWGTIGWGAGLAGAAVVGLTSGWSRWTLAVSGVLGFAGHYLGAAVDCRRRLLKVYRQNEQTAASLLDSIRATERLNEELQEKVERRTAELSRANRSLEKAFGDLKASQEKVIQSERQAAAGVLASGMAHEMNNPINAIRLSLQELTELARGRADMRPALETAGRAASRCQRIVGELLSFSREPKLIESTDLEDILNASVAIFERENPATVRIVKEVMPGLPRVELDRAQIQQAIHNLLTNAADAMDGKGEIEVSLSARGGDLVLGVSDRGPGMSEEVRRRVFDPFFSTKTGGKGLGLGLSITYQLVTRNGGAIEVASREGAGATFIVRFPVKGQGNGTTRPEPEFQD